MLRQRTAPTNANGSSTGMSPTWLTGRACSTMRAKSRPSKIRAGQGGSGDDERAPVLVKRNGAFGTPLLESGKIPMSYLEDLVIATGYQYITPEVLNDDPLTPA